MAVFLCIAWSSSALCISVNYSSFFLAPWWLILTINLIVLRDTCGSSALLGVPGGLRVCDLALQVALAFPPSLFSCCVREVNRFPSIVVFLHDHELNLVKPGAQITLFPSQWTFSDTFLERWKSDGCSDFCVSYNLEKFKSLFSAWHISLCILHLYHFAHSILQLKQSHLLPSI